MKIYYLLPILAFMSCESNPKSTAENIELPGIDSVYVENHLSTLSSDDFEGRMPATPGGKKTVAYLEKELKNLGLAPAFGDSYLQEVPLVEIDGEVKGPMQIEVKGETIELSHKDDFVVVTERPVEEISISSSELIFCGYGIVAPEYDWNDYQGIDTKGKTAVVLVNDPGLGMDSDSLFKGNIMTYYGRWTYKYEEADRHGLDGIILIHETNMAGYPWFVVKTGWTGPQLHINQNGSNEDCPIKGWIHLDAAKNLFDKCDLDLSSLIKQARKSDFKPVAMNARVTVGLTNKLKRDTSYNVVGISKGTSNPDEHIVFTAHWDHLGIGAPIDNDSIYNGALDNATGTASLLGLAKSFAQVETPRSAVFCFVTAEEQGLLGSELYVNKPALPLSEAICNINLDAVNITGPSKDFTITGFGQSNLDEYTSRFAEKQERYVQGEQEPEKGFFFRSDHFNFAKKGVPALYGKGGYDHKSKGKEFAQKFKDDYTTNHYHQPSDEYKSGDWDLRGLLEDTELLFNLSHHLLNGTEWPEWSESSEFKSLDRRK